MPTTLAFAWNRESRLSDVLVVALGSAVVAAAAQIAVPLPFTPVPLTLQTLGVLVVAASLGSVRGAASLALYLAEGAFGLPVFAGGQAGFVHLIGPTAGYLYGFVAAAYLIGWLAERGFDRKFAPSFFSFLVAQMAIFVLGVSWLALFVGRAHALEAGLLPFIPGELIKTAIASLALPAAWKLTPS